MTITYKPSNFDPEFSVPVLHKVVYAPNRDSNSMLYYGRTEKDFYVDEWLKENCQHRYYYHSGYTDDKFIEFECDEDAMLFALRFA